MKYPQFLVISDLDGTLTEPHSSWQYVMEKLGFWENHGKNHLQNFLDNKINYDEFIRLDVETWKGIEEKRYLEVINQIPFRLGTEKLFQFFKRNGAFVVLLSSGLMDLCERAKLLFPVDRIYANVIHKNNGILDGNFTQQVGWHGKRKIAVDLKKDFYGIPIITLGDAPGDIPLAEIADLSFACFSLSEELNKKSSYQITILSDIINIVQKFLQEKKIIEK
ncbi:MAG: HAD family hydrolase [Candidatus Hodarchaeales archaeon]